MDWEVLSWMFQFHLLCQIGLIRGAIFGSGSVKLQVSLCRLSIALYIRDYLFVCIANIWPSFQGSREINEVVTLESLLVV